MPARRLVSGAVSLIRPKRLLAAAIVCALATPAGAQQPRVSLSLTVEQAMLIVDTLKQIRCDTVQQMIVCDKARALLEAIQAQAREQVK